VSRRGFPVACGAAPSGARAPAADGDVRVPRRAALRLGMGLALAVGMAHPGPAGAVDVPRRVSRVAWISVGARSGDDELLAAIKKSLAEQGFVEGRNVAFEARYADGRQDRLAALADELVAGKPDVIIAGATPATRAARRATGTVPIVMVGVADPVGAGLIESFARPGGNVTGVANMGLEMAAKPFELLREILPDARRLAMVTTDNPGAVAVVQRAEEVLQPQGVRFRHVVVTSAAQFAPAVADLGGRQTDGVVVLGDTILITHCEELARRLADARLPAVGTYSRMVESGLLASIGPNPRNLHKSVARYVGAILRGAAPSGMPVEQPTEIAVAVNLATAERLNVRIPPSVFERADERYR
jgi:putative tryptophan/tyrosine transport system substrate-binding protein